MKLVFVRHGETREGKKGILLGSLDGNLTLKGRREAKQIGNELIKKRIIPDVIISSPLARAVDTANIIARILGRKVTQNALVRERKSGVAEGKKEKEIDWNTYEKKPIRERKHKGGESFSDVYKRAEKFLIQIQKRNKKETILVVSHSVFILMCIAILRHKTIEQILKKKPKDKIIVIHIKK